MADDRERYKQYDYKSTSNIVLAPDRRTDAGRGRGGVGGGGGGGGGAEPTGEPGSLAGRLIGKMGDRVQRTKPEALQEGAAGAAAAKRKRRALDPDAGATGEFLVGGGKRGTGGGKRGGGGGSSLYGGASVLDVDTAGFYRPRTRETRAAYEALLNAVHAAFGDQPRDVLRGAADEVLAALKDERRTDPERQREVGDLLGAPVGDDRFAELVAIGKLITDYVAEGAGGGGDGDGEDGQGGEDPDADAGVAVEFEDEDEDEPDEVGVVVDTDEDKEDLGARRMPGRGGQRGGGAEGADGGSSGSSGSEDGSGSGSDDEDDEVAAARRRRRARQQQQQQAAAAQQQQQQVGDQQLPVTEIDAYWLQRKVAAAFGGALDAPAAQALADRVAAALRAAPSAAAAEGPLVQLLGLERFDLARELLRHRAKVAWVTALRQAQTDAERAAVERDMARDPEAGAVLEELRATRASARDRQAAVEERIRDEARRLRDDAAAGNGAAGGAGALSAAATSGRHDIDIESLAFAAGGHVMTNKAVQLPPGTTRVSKKGYEEVSVPAPKPPPMAAGEELRAIDALPAWARGAFSGMRSLNRVQSRVCDCALFSGENMLVCAPTGAGKTNVAVLAVLRELGLHKRQDSSLDLAAFKIVYVAPMKALVAEMVGNFTKRLGGGTEYGLTVRELTGDVSLTRQEVEAAQIVVTTPEKWDVVTRRGEDAGGGGGAGGGWGRLVRLVILDEVHLLHDTRGPVIESLVARTLRGVEATGQPVRIVGLSATLPNYEDVAAFLRVRPDKGLFHFDAAYRPCPLATQFVGITVKKPLQRFALMNDVCYDKTLAHAGKSQVLIFVHSRKETAKTARHLKERALKDDALPRFLRDDSASAEILRAEAEACKDPDLRDLLPYGFAVHHAGMARADRTLVEDLFADGHVQVLCSTATLAWGVNLPAHTVIIKGTEVYSPEKGGWDELSAQDVLQMLGRAGRPQYDTHGEGVIITQHGKLQFWLSLMGAQLPIESQLAALLPDALNAEIASGGVASLRDAAAWLGYTYLYVRMLRSPGTYGIGPADAEADPVLLDRRLDLAHSAALVLDRARLARYDRRTGALAATDLGRVASRYYVTHGTLSAFHAGLRPHMGEIELLRLFAAADEFRHMVVREEEKLELARLIDRVPVPIKESLDDPAAKVNVLLQAHVSGLKLEGLALASDMVYVTQSAGRLMRCLFEVCLRRGWARPTEAALTLAKEVAHRQWASQTPLRQFRGVPGEVLVRLEKKVSVVGVVGLRLGARVFLRGGPARRASLLPPVLAPLLAEGKKTNANTPLKKKQTTPNRTSPGSATTSSPPKNSESSPACPKWARPCTASCTLCPESSCRPMCCR
jgi:pre-mRNA-splicing helicase BRR2